MTESHGPSDAPTPNLEAFTATPLSNSGRTTPTNTNRPPVQSTPIRKKIAGFAMFASAIPERNISRIQRQVAKETQGHYVGPMPIRQFFDEFMPWNDKTPKTYRSMALNVDQARIDALVEMASLPEAHMYAKFVEAFDGWPFDFSEHKKKAYIKCPFRVKDTHAAPDPACGNLSIDLSVVSATNPRITRAAPRDMDFANLESFIELKEKVGADAFCDGEVAYDSDTDGEVAGRDEVHQAGDEEVDEAADEEEDVDVAADPAPVDFASPEDDIDHPDSPPSPSPSYPFENETLIGRHTRGQYAVYAGVTMSLQYRSHLFTILVCGNFARLTRWDRSAAIVTRSFDYTEQPEYLFEYFARFAQLTECQRGLDRNVDRPTVAQGHAARRAFQKQAPELWRGEAGPIYAKQFSVDLLPLLRMTFMEEVYIIPAPLFHDGFYSPFSRSTRRGLVMRVRDGRLFYLKDYFREDSKITLPESAIYDRLRAHNIPNVASLSAGGDVESMETVGHKFTDCPWVHLGTALRIRRLQGHRLILESIGRDLRTFSYAKELVTCLGDAMKAHQMAYEVAGILHRDISVGNIMMTLTPMRRGFLIDWDHSVVLEMLENHHGDKTRISRTGTWQFISGQLAENPGAAHTVIDDRESALLVLAYTAIRFLKHDLSAAKLSDHLDVFDSSWDDPRGGEFAGYRKSQAIFANTFSKIPFEQHLIAELLRELCETFAVRYADNPKVETETEKEGALDEDPFSARVIRRKEWQAAEKKAAEQRNIFLLDNLNDPQWLHETLDIYARRLRSNGTVDWIDNSLGEYERPKSNKRAIRDDDDDEYETRTVRRLKLSTGLDGTMSPPVSLEHS